jgi:hypothetical protein
MKLIKLIPLFFLLTSNSFSQWWVDGGNLLWPYGDVNVKENLNIDGDLKVEGVINSNQYQYIILHLYFSSEDHEFGISIYRNDIETTIDTAYFTGSPYPHSFLIEFSEDIIDPYSQQFIYSNPSTSAYTDSGFIPTQLEVKRWGSDKTIRFRFLDNIAEVPVDLFFCSAYIHLIIIPNTIIDQFSFWWE